MKHIQLIEREFTAAASEGNLKLYKFPSAYAILSFATVFTDAW